MTVLRHTGIILPISTVVPEFIFLSGLFYNTKLEFKEFLTKRIKVFIIPLFFFYVISYLFYYLATLVYPPFSEMTDANGILDIFTQKQLFNGPLWFLPALFWVHIIYYPIKKYIKLLEYRFGLTIGIGFLGCTLGYYDIFMPMYIDSALSLMPFIFVSNELFKLEYLNNRKFITYLTVALCTIIFITIFYKVGIHCTLNKYGNIMDYILCVIIITHISIFILFICKLLNLKNFFFNFLGKNSMLIMCIHHLIYRPVKLISANLLPSELLPTFTCIVTLLIIFAIAPIFNKYLPWAVGKIK